LARYVGRVANLHQYDTQGKVSEYTIYMYCSVYEYIRACSNINDLTMLVF
jgi:hypothetical protein